MDQAKQMFLCQFFVIKKWSSSKYFSQGQHINRKASIPYFPGKRRQDHPPKKRISNQNSNRNSNDNNVNRGMALTKCSMNICGRAGRTNSFTRTLYIWSPQNLSNTVNALNTHHLLVWYFRKVLWITMNGFIYKMSDCCWVWPECENMNSHIGHQTKSLV